MTNDWHKLWMDVDAMQLEEAGDPAKWRVMDRDNQVQTRLGKEEGAGCEICEGKDKKVARCLNPKTCGTGGCNGRVLWRPARVGKLTSGSGTCHHLEVSFGSFEA